MILQDSVSSADLSASAIKAFSSALEERDAFSCMGLDLDAIIYCFFLFFN
jgi:hypothetical protein